jgi:hypothetical protein
VSRPTFHDLLRKHDIDAGRFRRPGGPDDEGDESEEMPA